MGMLKEKLELLAVNLGMIASYGRRDHLNLLTFEDNDTTTRFILFPLEFNHTFEPSSGNINSTIWSGSFMILERSSLDEYYNEQKGSALDGKYQLHINPMVDKSKSILNSLICDNSYIVKAWKLNEVINILDMNADGVGFGKTSRQNKE